ncbi:MAG: class I adenylate-forming enzyme family protein, partial [Pseudomonadota bacterium]
MNDTVPALAKAISELTAEGAPFAVANTSIGGNSYRVYESVPANVAEYFKFMLGHGDKDFAVYLNERYTFAEAYAQAAAFAHALQQDFGVKKGDRVAILSRNNPQWMISFIGILSIGAVAVPMNGWWTTEELDYGVQDSGSMLIVADKQRLERLAPLQAPLELTLIGIGDCAGVDARVHAYDDVVAKHAGKDMPEVAIEADDYATIMYTSGSTGHPKGALSSHRGIVSALYSWILLGLASRSVTPENEADSGFAPAGLVTVPLFHCTGSHTAFLLSLVIGRKLVIMHKWDAQEALRLIEEERITWFTGVPTMSAELQAAAAESDRDVSSLKEIYGGGAAR